jgi:methylated-DNA-[protein]-cysteine S-methyltransferase
MSARRRRAPKKARRPPPRACISIESPIGTLRIEADEEAVRIVAFAEERRAASDGEVAGAARALVQKAAAELAEYFAGDRHEFSVPVAPEGTRFQTRVWRELQRIGYGSTRSYGEVARSIGHRRAARAVGAANHENPVAVIVPCHRVIGVDRTLVGYGGGLDKKEWLLRHEAKHAGTVAPAPAGPAAKVAARAAGR